MATLAELRSRVLANLDRSDANSTEQGYVTDWINQFIREDLCQKHNWDFMEHVEDVSTTDGVDEYAFPDSGSGDRFKDCRWIRFRTKSDEDFWEIEEVPVRALYQGFTEQTRGQPVCWARVGENKFKVRFIPDASTYEFRIHVWEYPAALTSDGDSNTLTNSYTRLVEFGATARGFLHYGEFNSASYWSSAVANERDNAIKVDWKRLAPSQRTFKPSTAAGRPALGLSRSGRFRTSPFSWWTP